MSLSLIMISIVMSGFCCMNVNAKDMIIDDRSTGSAVSNLGSEWRLFTDQVMGGVSTGSLSLDRYLGRDCLRIKGQVFTQNNGGFVQIALDLTADKPYDASAYEGIVLDVAGNNEQYNLHLRTSGLWLPWQSYRAGFKATDQWNTIKIPFAQLKPYRTTRALRTDKIKRLGLVAIGREFNADLCVGSVKFYGTADDEK
jgi:hypothetical protein